MTEDNGKGSELKEYANDQDSSAPITAPPPPQGEVLESAPADLPPTPEGPAVDAASDVKEVSQDTSVAPPVVSTDAPPAPVTQPLPTQITAVNDFKDTRPDRNKHGVEHSKEPISTGAHASVVGRTNS